MPAGTGPVVVEVSGSRPRRGRPSPSRVAAICSLGEVRGFRLTIEAQATKEMYEKEDSRLLDGPLRLLVGRDGVRRVQQQVEDRAREEAQKGRKQVEKKAERGPRKQVEEQVVKKVEEGRKQVEKKVQEGRKQVEKGTAVASTDPYVDLAPYYSLAVSACGVCSLSIGLIVLPAVAQMSIVDAVARMNCEPALDTDER